MPTRPSRPDRSRSLNRTSGLCWSATPSEPRSQRVPSLHGLTTLRRLHKHPHRLWTWICPPRAFSLMTTNLRRAVPLQRDLCHPLLRATTSHKAPRRGPATAISAPAPRTQRRSETPISGALQPSLALRPPTPLQTCHRSKSHTMRPWRSGTAFEWALPTSRRTVASLTEVLCPLRDAARKKTSRVRTSPCATTTMTRSNAGNSPRPSKIRPLPLRFRLHPESPLRPWQVHRLLHSHPPQHRKRRRHRLQTRALSNSRHQKTILQHRKRSPPRTSLRHLAMAIHRLIVWLHRSTSLTPTGQVCRANPRFRRCGRRPTSSKRSPVLGRKPRSKPVPQLLLSLLPHLRSWPTRERRRQSCPAWLLRPPSTVIAPCNQTTRVPMAPNGDEPRMSWLHSHPRSRAASRKQAQICPIRARPLATRIDTLAELPASRAGMR